MIVEAMYDRDGRPVGIVCHVAVERNYLEDIAYQVHGLSGDEADAVIDAAIEAMPRVLENIEGLDGDILDQCEGVFAAVAGDRKKTIGQGV